MELKEKIDAICSGASIGPYSSKQYGLTIEIVKTEPFDKGVAVFVRAWKDDKQLGFGDGSVEIEKIRIVNPNILTPDGTTRTIKDGMRRTIEVPNFKEDPCEAIKADLAHTVALIGKSNTQIEPGKVGTTVTTFFPDAAAVDGTVGRGVVSSSWASIRNDAGNISTSLPAADNAFYLIADPVAGLALNTRNGVLYSALTTHNGVAMGSLQRRNGFTDALWEQNQRTIVLFDTSAIPNGDTISSAKLSGYGFIKLDGLAISPDVNVFTSTPADPTLLAAADYSQTQNVQQCDTPITYAGFSLVAYNDFTLNATGIGNINKTGISKFCLKNQNYDANNIQPAWIANMESYLTIYGGGSGLPPKLLVDHAP